MRKVYLDYATTTPVRKEVLAAMLPYFSENFGNPSEPHQWGQEAKRALEEARQKVADFLGAKPKELIFTSCATESINLSHKGLIEGIKYKVLSIKYPHVIISPVEHKAVIETCRYLEKSGMAKVTYLPVDKYGMVKVSDVEKVIRPETVLVSIMYVNNEVGTVEPIKEIGELLKTHNKIYFHSDITQAIQYLPINVDKFNLDFLSLTGHKIYGPKGVGVLYVRNGTPLSRQQDGGGQEMGRRSGTENVPYIVGLAKALELVENERKSASKRIEKLRDRLIEGVLKIPKVTLTGHPTKRTPHIASFIVDGVEGEAMLLYLNEYGIAASSGSACTSDSLEPSHVLLAMGIPPELAHGSLRLSLGKETIKEDIDYVINVLPGIIDKLRKMAPKL